VRPQPHDPDGQIQDGCRVVHGNFADHSQHERSAILRFEERKRVGEAPGDVRALSQQFHGWKALR